MGLSRTKIDFSLLRRYNIGMDKRISTNKRNYDKEMTELIARIPKGERLLLHSCCAPCSSACLQRLKEHFSVTVFYYNPNIDLDEEYQKRKAEQLRFLQQTGWADILDCDHDKQAFERLVQGYENEPERGKRCALCYRLRLEKTAQAAKENGYNWFCTTLTVSPYKNADWLNEIGQEIGDRYGLNYLLSDFKKQGGYLLSTKLSAQYGLYRQDFCGCKYSQKNK